MTGVKNEHYVPQFYLKRFASDTDQICVFDKASGKMFQTHVRNVASEGKFYDFPADVLQQLHDDAVRAASIPDIDTNLLRAAQDPQLIEHELSTLEGAFALILDDVLASVESTQRLKHEHKEAMAQYIVLQFLRTKEQRLFLTQVRETLWRELCESFGFDVQELPLDLGTEYASVQHAEVMFDPHLHERLIGRLVEDIWMIGVNEAEQPLYTSDHPVVKWSHRGAGFSALGSQGIEIVLPLTSRYALNLCDRQDFHLLAGYDLGSIPLNADNVTHFNSLQVQQSHRYVYSSTNQFELAERIRREIPDTADLNRPRIVVQRMRQSQDRSSTVDNFSEMDRPKQDTIVPSRTHQGRNFQPPLTHRTRRRIQRTRSGSQKGKSTR